MGRPAWANEAQWLWLTSQAAEYMEIKGNKKKTAKFWPTYLDGWKEQWPTPALTDVVNEASITTSTTVATEAHSEEVPAVAVADKKKAKKPLTVGMVCR
jgi:hypothetical protein